MRTNRFLIEHSAPAEEVDEALAAQLRAGQEERLRRMTAAPVFSMCPQGDIEVNAGLKAGTVSELVVDTIRRNPPEEHDILI